MNLTDKKCKLAKPEDRQYKLFDGGGLYLLVRPNGSKLWQLKYRFLKKEKVLSIGEYPTIGLADAREARSAAKKLLAQNPPIDPMEEKKAQRREVALNAQNTFKTVAMEWYDLKKDGWSQNYAYKIKKGLELNVFPFIGDRPIKEITPTELLNECLRRIEKRGSLDIAARTKQICGLVFRYGIPKAWKEWSALTNSPPIWRNSSKTSLW